MTNEQKQRLKWILSRAKSEYNNRAQDYDKSVSKKYRQELLKDIWHQFTDKFKDQGALDAVEESLERLIKDCLNNFDEHFLTRFITDYSQKIEQHNE